MYVIQRKLAFVYQGEETLRTGDIVAKIMEEGDSIALVYIPGT